MGDGEDEEQRHSFIKGTLGAALGARFGGSAHAATARMIDRGASMLAAVNWAVEVLPKPVAELSYPVHQLAHHDAWRIFVREAEARQARAR